MNEIYEIREGRPFWKLRPVMLLITLVAVLLIAVALLILVVSGPVADSIGSVLGIGSLAVTVWSYVKWPVLGLVMVLVVALLYYATPNVKQPKFRWVSVGAGVAIVTWLVASLLFGIYVANFSNYNKTYGSLGGVIVGLLWLWITNLALLLGAEVDSEMERGRQLQAGIPAERDLQLPVRDTSKIEKDEKKEAEDEARGREIRLAAGRDNHDSQDDDSLNDDKEGDTR
jgi:membrane protein